MKLFGQALLYDKVLHIRTFVCADFVVALSPLRLMVLKPILIYSVLIHSTFVVLDSNKIRHKWKVNCRPVMQVKCYQKCLFGMR